MKHLCKKHNLNKIFWQIIYMLPIFSYLIALIHNQSAIFMNGYGINDNNIIYTTLYNIFGENGILPIFNNNNVILLFFTYFIGMEILHITVDILVMLPRIAQSFNDKINNSGDNEE